MIDDSELLQRYAAEKSEAAFTELVSRHVGLVYSSALRRLGGDVHGAGDVAQQVFIKLARDAKKLRGHSALTAWLYTATRHAVIDAIRAERRRQARDREAHLMQEFFSPDAPSHSAHGPDWEQLQPVLDAAMDELSEQDREAVLLRFFEGRPYVSIGTTLRVSEDAARMRVDRALEKLRTLLSRRGVTSTAGTLSTLLANQATAAVPAGLAGTAVVSAMTAQLGVTGGAGASGLFGFMSAMKLGLAGGLVLLVLVGLATFEGHQRVEVEQDVARLRGYVKIRMAALRAKENRAREAEQGVARTRAQIEATRLKLTEAGKEQSAGRAWDPMEEGWAYLARNPEVNRAFGAYVSASLRFQYAPMYRALNWSEEQVRRFELFRGQGVTMGSFDESGRTIAMVYGARNDRSTLGKLAMEAMGGPEGLKSYAEFQSLGTARRVTRDVASALYFTESPLSPAQADQVVQILLESRNVGPARKSGEFDWDAVLSKSQAVLSTEQLAVIAAKRSGELFRLALNRAVNLPGTNAAPAKTKGN